MSTETQNIETRITSALRKVSPKYDELTLYLYGISFLLLFLIDTEFSNALMKAGIFAFVLLIGALYSIVNVFVRKDTLESEKSIIVMFIIVSNVFMIYAYKESTEAAGSSIIQLNSIPIVANTVYAVYLFVLSNYKAFDETNLIYLNASGKQILVVTLSLVISFICSHYFLGSKWIYTYSWSVFLSISVKDLMLYYYPSSKV